MKLTIDQAVFFGVTPHTIRKEFEVSIIPHAGDFIEDSVWKEPYKVSEVVISYQDNSCYVLLEPYKDKLSEKQRDEFTRMVKLHDWKPLWEF